jgi:hypothetical protein
MTNLNTVFAKGFSLSLYYGTTFSSGSAPSSGPISYSMFSGKSAAPSVVITASVSPTIASGRTFYTFTGNGTFTIAGGTKSVEIMAIGGGGGGGVISGGGGGAGNMIVATGTLTAATYSIVVGNGGVGGVNNNANESPSTTGGNGGSSTFTSSTLGLILTALGGGGGGTHNSGSVSGGGGQNGGCGGGGTNDGNSAGGSAYIVGGTGVVGTVSSPLTATSNLATNGGMGWDELGVG